MRGIYEGRNSFTNDVYYGQSKNIQGRIKRHIHDLKNNKHKNEHLQFAWNKYGASAFIWSTVEIVEDLSINLTSIEQRYYDSTLHRYNEARPGDPTFWTAAMRKKISIARKGKYPSMETKLKMSVSRTGKMRSSETRKKQSIALTGNKNAVGNSPSVEARKKMSIARLNYYATKRLDTF